LPSGRTSRRGRRWSAGLFCGLAVVLAGQGAQAETVLRARLASDILSTEPGGRRDENTDAVLMHVVEGLVASREDGTVGPLLAKGWTISKDGKTYTFALRSGVRFHNGQPLSADDVVWSLKRYLDPKTHWRCSAEFGEHGIARVLSVTAPDPMTVVMTLDRPAPLLLKLKHGIASRLVFSKWRAAFGGRIRLLLSGGAALPAFHGERGRGPAEHSKRHGQIQGLLRGEGPADNP